MKAELTKGDVYVVVDTPKKAKKLKKLLDMFKEPISKYPNHESICHNGSVFGWRYGFDDGKWQGFNTKWVGHNGKKFKKVSIKELRNILAKEDLRKGDYVVSENNFICRIDKVENNGIHFSNPFVGVYDISYFKRYATPEEIALLETKEVDKFAELKEAHKNGKKIECRLRYSYCTWIEKTHEGFLNKFEYRIKPEEIKDSDIATIEALHDVLLDNHKYDLNSKLLTNARELCKKIQNIVGG